MDLHKFFTMVLLLFAYVDEIFRNDFTTTIQQCLNAKMIRKVYR